MRTKSVKSQAPVAASDAEAVVSQPFAVSETASLYFKYYVKFSALNSEAGITGRLQHSAGDGVWRDVGTQSEFTTTQQAQSLGDYASNTVQTDDASAFAQGDGFLMYGVFGASSVKFAFWLNIDGDDTEPTGLWYTSADYQVEVGIASDATAAEIADAIVSAVGDYVDVEATWSAVAVDDVVTFTGNELGSTTNPVSYTEDGGMASAFVVTAVNEGADRSFIDSDTVTSGSYAFTTGDRVVFSADELPDGLVGLDEVFAIQVDEFTFQLAATQADAATGTPVSLANGLGLLTVAKADYSVHLDATDSSDVTQLPLWPTARVVLTTGADDSATIQDVRVFT